MGMFEAPSLVAPGPDTECPNPAGNDFCIRIQPPATAITTGFQRALIFGVWNNGGVWLNGDTFTVSFDTPDQSYSFTWTVDNGIPTSATTINLGGTDEQNWLEFRNAFMANFAFIEWTITMDFTETSPTVYVVSISFKNGVENLILDDTGMTSTLNMLAFPGAVLEIANGFKIVYQLIDRTGRPITKVEAVTPKINAADLDWQSIRLDFKSDLLKEVHSPLLLQPDFTGLLNLTLGDFHQTVQLRYANSYLDVDGCTVLFDEFQITDEYDIVDALFQIDDPLGIDPYCTYIQNPIRPWTVRPLCSYICPNGCAWFTVYSSIEKQFPTYIVTYFARYWFYDENDVLISTFDINYGPAVDPAFRVQAGPCNILGFPAGVKRYEVRAMTTINAFPGLEFGLTDMMEFYIEDCPCDVELYFLSDIGNWETIGFHHIDQIDVVVDQIEVCEDTVCSVNDTLNYRTNLQRGRQQVGTVAYENFTVLSKQIEDNDENRQFFIQFKKAEQRLIKITDTNGDIQSRAIIVKKGKIRIFKKDDMLQLKAEFRYSHDLAVLPD